MISQHPSTARKVAGSRQAAGLMAAVLVVSVVAGGVPARAAEQSLVVLAGDVDWDDQFGSSVAVSGGAVVVGSPYDDDVYGGSGSAYVFRRDAGGWILEEKLTASDPEQSDYFGSSVAIDGDWIAVGSPLVDDVGTGYVNTGAVYLFHNDGGSWSEQGKIDHPEPWPNENFGRSVAMRDGTLLVGVPNEEYQRGAVWVFHNDGGLWSEQAKLVASDREGGDNFGNAVAISGDTAVIGAYFNDDACDPPDSLCQSGSAYVFQRSGSVWSEQSKLLASDQEEGDYFGNSVAIDGTRALVSALWDDDLDTNSGAVYVYSGGGGGWTEVDKLTASDGGYEDRFGSSVAVSGDRAIIGAYWVHEYNNGAAYAFAERGIWTELSKGTGSGCNDHAEFGKVVAIDGYWVVIGAHWEDNPDGSTGDAYVYRWEDMDPDMVRGDGFEEGSTGAWSSVMP